MLGNNIHAKIVLFKRKSDSFLMALLTCERKFHVLLIQNCLGVHAKAEHDTGMVA